MDIDLSFVHCDDGCEGKVGNLPNICPSVFNWHVHVAYGTVRS